MACAPEALLAVPILARLRVVPRRIRILTVDSQESVQEGLAATIDREPDMTVVATASTGEEAFSDVRRYKPDVVTLDLLLPDMPGEELARCILAEFPQIRIVAITSATSHIHARRALDAGIHGYLSKASLACEVVHAIRQVQAGARAITGPVALQTAECSRRGHDGNNRTSEVQGRRPLLAVNPAHRVPRNRQRRDSSVFVSGGRSGHLLFLLDRGVVEETFHRQSTGCGARRSC
jgi:DNA-binding NarL/FixJ family response regulator